MILPFSTHINGKPSHFIEKIWKGIKYGISRELYFTIAKTKHLEELNKKYPINIETFNGVKPKIHTLRKDKNNIWQPGTLIEFAIEISALEMFVFAPVLPVVSIQKIEIIYISIHRQDKKRPWVKIDGKPICWIDETNNHTMLRLAQNDGFDTLEDFFEYFNDDFTGKIIHWTDFKY